jgi:transcriptional regulator with XRE-family HTH domain
VNTSTGKFTFVKFSPTKLRQLFESDRRKAKDIAAGSNFSAPALSMWMSGKRVPGADEVAALAVVFGVRLEDLFDGADLPLKLSEDLIPYQTDPPISKEELAKLKRQVVILEGAVSQIKNTIKEMEL